MPQPVTASKHELPVPTVDAAWVREMCSTFGAHCEVARCTLPAQAVFLHPTVAALLCEMHDTIARTHPVIMAAALRTALRNGLNLHSFTAANRESGGALLAAIRARQDELDAEARREARRPNQEARELRKIIRASGIKVGMPDDDLLVARQRQALRAQAGQPTLGPARKTPQPPRPAVHPPVSDEGLFPIRPIL